MLSVVSFNVWPSEDLHEGQVSMLGMLCTNWCLSCTGTSLGRMTTLEQLTLRYLKFQLLVTMVKCFIATLYNNLHYGIVFWKAQFCMAWFCIVTSMLVITATWACLPHVCSSLHNNCILVCVWKSISKSYTLYLALVCNANFVYFVFLYRLCTNVWANICQHLWLPQRIYWLARQIWVPQ